MGRRSAGAWRELFEAQEQSGMSVREFCTKHGLCAKSFLRRRKTVGQRSPGAAASPFVRVETAAEQPSGATAPTARLRLGRCEWELSGLQLGELVRLMAALA